jgi:hypothetical protein
MRHVLISTLAECQCDVDDDDGDGEKVGLFTLHSDGNGTWQ